MHLGRKWPINLISFTWVKKQVFSEYFFKSHQSTWAWRGLIQHQITPPTLKMSMKSTGTLQTLRTDITIYVPTTPAVDTILAKSALPQQPPPGRPPLAPHCNTLVTAARKLRLNVSIVFWGRLISMRTWRHTVVRQADSYRWKQR